MQLGGYKLCPSVRRARSQCWVSLPTDFLTKIVTKSRSESESILFGVLQESEGPSRYSQVAHFSTLSD